MGKKITNFEIQQIATELKDNYIANVINSIKGSLKYDLETYLNNNHNCFWKLDLKRISNLYPRLQKEKCNNNYISRMLKDNPLVIINELADFIKSFNERKRIQLYQSYTSGDKPNKKLYSRYKISISDSKYLISTENINIVVINKVTNTIVPVNINYEIDYINHFSSELLLYTEFEFLNSLESISFEDYHIDIEIHGQKVSYNEDYPEWIEHIIMASLYQEGNNYRMATLFSFIALDSFIVLLYKETFSILCNYRNNRSIKDKLQLNIDDNIEYDISELYYEFSSSGVINRTIKRVDSYLANHYEDYCLEIIEKRNRLIKQYEVDDRKLIRHKLKYVRKALGISTDSKEFLGIMKLLDKIKRYEELRNDIAHGNKLRYGLTGYEFGDMLTYILTLVYRQDLIVSDWKPLVVRSI